jgi:hypothetical protein
MSEIPAAENTNLPPSAGDASAALMELVVQENSGLVCGADGLCFQVQEQIGKEALLKALDAIAAKGLAIKDFRYGQVTDYLVEDKAPPHDRILLGGNLVSIEPARLEAFEKSVISDDKEGHFEFFPGAPLPAGRDEFLAVLWRNGIKFGIDTASLEATLGEGAAKPGRYLVARAIPPVEGRDAKPVPKVNFQRQRAIKEAAAGTGERVDLHFYECGFPQVPEGPGPHALLEKQPALPGRAGRNVSGKVLETRPVKDFDLARMAGTGTRVMAVGGKPTIVTDHGGYFIDVDAQQQISVSPHARNSFPVGPKTGSFEVTGERFEQCGDIEHQYLLVGRSIDITAGAVRGTVISKAGNILINGRIENAGQVEAEAGDVAVNGAVIGGRVVALAGSVSVKSAEGSVLIAHEVNVEETATNCFIIADVMRIGRAAGTSFYAQNVMIDTLDLAVENANPVTGFITLRDNLNARKIIRRFEKRRKRLEKVEQIETLVREQGLAEAWLALDARFSRGVPLSPEETQQFGPLLKPYEYVRHRRDMAARDRAFFADPKSTQQAETAKQAVEAFRNAMMATVGLDIRSTTYPDEVAKLLAQQADANPTAVINAAPQSFFAYVSSDPTIADLAKREKKLQKLFLAFVSRMLAGTVMNEARIRPLRSLALLRSPCTLNYENLLALANAEDQSQPAGERRNDSARIEIHRDVVIPVVVDGYSIGRLRNVSDHGASLMFDDTQENPPVFERLEEVQLIIQPGHIVERQGNKTANRPLSGWEEQRCAFSITAIIENDSAGLIKIGGNYAHMNEEAFNRARRLRTQIEALMLQVGRET